LHFLLVYIHMRHGGIETLIVRMANWLVKRGHKVTLFLKEPGDLLSDLDEKVEVEILGLKRFWFYLPFLGAKCLRKFGAKNVNVIYSYGPEGCFLASYIYKHAFKVNKPIFLNGIYHPHEFALSGKPNILDRMYINLYNLHINDGTKIFMSDEVRSATERILGQKVSRGAIWPLPIDGERFINKPKKIIPYRILSIGRYANFKTYNLYMIDVVEKLVEQGYDATWEVYGYGPLEAEMKKLVKERNLGDRIFIRGPLAYNKCVESLAQAHVWVGVGTALLEAGFCGVPCVPAIAYDTKGLTYGGLYDLPYYTCGEVLNDNFETIPVVTAISRIFDMTEAEYQAEANHTFQYVQPYSMNSLMQKFLEYAENAPRMQNIESYSNWKYVLYCFKWLWFQARSTFAVRTRLRRLIRFEKINQ